MFCHLIPSFSEVTTARISIASGRLGRLQELEKSRGHNDCELQCLHVEHRCVIHVLASGWKTARVVVLLFEYGGWVGWGGILTFMYHAYRRGCYAAATSLVRGWVGWGGILTFMYLAYTICFMKLAVTVRASSASPRKRNGETC